MASVKRKMPSTGGGALSQGLHRRVRPRIEPEPESDVDEAPSEEDAGFNASGSEDEEEDEGASGTEEEDSEAESESSDEAGNVAAQLSFGALARAQASMGSAAGRKRPGQRRGSGSSAGAEEAEAEKKPVKLGYKWHDDKPRETREEREKRKALLKRSSKHAPVEMTSKKPVSRKRDFIEVRKVQARDPRFGPLGGGQPEVDEVKAHRAYAFLDDYMADEMKQLREAIKKTKDANEKEKLQRALMSMESKKKARDRKEKERLLIEEHRKKEKELVKEGKQPFYLKKSEQKKRLLMDQFAGMKKGQVDKAIERKRKKVAGKEKKALPYGRRTADDRV
ncbi:hypothetical protein B0H66DRAFT_118541 [Apodospora peruviana]|uniref:rRNA biogenesis protein RRP36 n=1 Tax=Apodospora peruviana TaxID=516989 RepID=A0AAE0IHX2_9PEZI|nr:hypothetical protein B0H66DRAFT_118541 [Apodospora peruviana]